MRIEFVEKSSQLSHPFSRMTKQDKALEIYKRLSKAIQTYLMENDIEDEKPWQVDVAAIFLDLERKTATIRMTFDVGL